MSDQVKVSVTKNNIKIIIIAQNIQLRTDFPVAACSPGMPIAGTAAPALAVPGWERATRCGGARRRRAGPRRARDLAGAGAGDAAVFAASPS